MSVLPVVFLAATYFLLVEFGVRESYPGFAVTPLLRVGGGAIAVLFIAVALGCGMLIADQLRRPIRTILGVSQGGGGSSLDGPDSQIPADAETRRLLMRVEDLVHHNRAGAQALSDLETLQEEEAEIVDEFRRAGDERGLPSLSVAAQTSVRSSAPLRVEIERFTQQLRIDMQSIDARLEKLGETLGKGGIMEASMATEVEASLKALEQLATVWSLRVERARRDIPDLPGELGSCFRDFTEALGRLRESLRTDTWGGTTLMDDARSEIASLQETISGWLKNEKGATQ